MSNSCTDEGVIRIAGEIKRYLGNNPKGADTNEGITQWWLRRQRIEESVVLVQQALDYLVSESLVERKDNIKGVHLYFSVQQSHNGEQ